MSNNINTNQDDNIEVKLEKLLEIIKDIEDNGMEGDHVARQLVLTAISKSDNEDLYKKLEDLLLEDNSSEVTQTVCAGLIMSKGKGEPLIKFVNKYFPDEAIISEQFEDKESLLLVTDGLVESIIKSEDIDFKTKCFNSLVKLYKGSCTPKSTALMADKLLQRFMNVLPAKDSFIDEKLLTLIQDKEAELNSRIIAIDILGRSNPIGFFNDIENFIEQLDTYSNNSYEQVFFLDVITKFINNLIVSGIVVNHYNAIAKIKLIDFKILTEQANAVYNEDITALTTRIQNRISKIDLKNNN